MITFSRALAPFLILLGVAAAALPAQEAPPSIRYGSMRESKKWIDIGGTQVAVDEGIAWKGVKVWLSLTFELVATDAASGKTLWHENVGAFWNEIGFKEVETAPGKKTWAVELRPGAGARPEEAGLRQHHDLRTGKQIGEADAAPPGKKIELARHWSGHVLATPKPVQRLVGSAADWKATVALLFSGVKDAPSFGAIDFSKDVVLVIATGETANCNGIDADAWEDDARMLVRLQMQTFQTGSFGEQRGEDLYDHMRPFGIFVLPRRDPFKPVIVERNEQITIGGPPIWSELCRFETLGDARPASRPAPQKPGR